MLWNLLPFGLGLLTVAILLAVRPRDKEQLRVEVAKAKVIYLRPSQRSLVPEEFSSKRLAIIRKSSLLR